MMDLIVRQLGREREAKLESAASLQDLIDLGVQRAITLWPEWGVAFTALDKGGQPATPGQPALPGIENRPMKPPERLIGERVAFHMGAHVGGRKGNGGHIDGLYALTETAKSAGWEVRLTARQGGPAWIEFHKGGKVVRLDTRWDPLSSGKPALPDAVGIVRSAITFTAIITGFEFPDAKPRFPWQMASDPEDSESWSYGWHVEQIIRTAKPIPCSGLQGFWPLTAALKARKR